MSLRPPTGTQGPGGRVELRFPDEPIARAVAAAAGSRLTIGDGGADDLALVAGAVDDRALICALVRSDDVELARFGAGEQLLVTWTETDDWLTARASVLRRDTRGLTIECRWPPSREQRRRFRRLAVDLPVWVARLGLPPDVRRGVTRDVSGGGLSAQVPGLEVCPGERVGVQLRCVDRDIVAPATVQWVRDGAVIGFAFEATSVGDQDHLSALVAQGEARRGR